MLEMTSWMCNGVLTGPYFNKIIWHGHLKNCLHYMLYREVIFGGIHIITRIKVSIIVTPTRS